MWVSVREVCIQGLNKAGKGRPGVYQAYIRRIILRNMGLCEIRTADILMKRTICSKRSPRLPPEHEAHKRAEELPLVELFQPLPEVFANLLNWSAATLRKTAAHGSCSVACPTCIWEISKRETDG